MLNVYEVKRVDDDNDDDDEVRERRNWPRCCCGLEYGTREQSYQVRNWGVVAQVIAGMRPQSPCHFV